MKTKQKQEQKRTNNNNNKTETSPSNHNRQYCSSKPVRKTRSTNHTPKRQRLPMFKLINTPGCVVLFREHD